jgi:hypothetical protein
MSRAAVAGWSVLLGMLALVVGVVLFGVLSEEQTAEPTDLDECVTWVMSEHPNNPDPVAVCVEMARLESE